MDVALLCDFLVWCGDAVVRWCAISLQMNNECTYYTIVCLSITLSNSKSLLCYVLYSGSVVLDCSPASFTMFLNDS